MKRLYFSFSIIFTYTAGLSQSGAWTWMKGANSFNGSAVFGTIGIADTNNTPPALYETAEWKDFQGRFWIFGGLLSSGSEASGFWMYDPSLNAWTCVANQNASYGTKGVPSPTNYPRARGWGASTWVDHNGNFWLFGGLSVGNGLNDLWKYDLSTGEWTWMAGSNLVSQTGTYGTMGVPDPDNTPGNRWECPSTWVDADGNLWLFGGFNFSGHWEDVWKFDVNTNEWTWMDGSNTVNQPAFYGTLGVPSPSNTPGGRQTYSKWTDPQNNFWLFGGYFNNEPQNDLWKFDPSTLEWTWMGGTNTGSNPGSYSSICTIDTTNLPRSRYENRACWTAPNGKFWLFGGGNDLLSTSVYNDLWYYDPSTNKWTWASGSNGAAFTAVYGVKGVPDTLNHPSGYTGAVGWIDDNCDLWLFGGCNTWSAVFSNTLWRFTPTCGNCFTSSATNFGASENFICEKFCTSFFDSSTNNPTSWEWLFPGGSPSASTDQNPALVCYDIPGVYDVTLITNGTDTFTIQNYITVYPTPAFPVITQNGLTLTSSVADFYQWQLNAIDIPGATNQSYTITQSGYYTVVITDLHGCQNSTSIDVLISGIEETDLNSEVLIYPNPSKESFIVEILTLPITEDASLNVLNSLGETISFTQHDLSNYSATTNSFRKEIMIKDASTGIYFIEIISKHTSIKKKIIIMK